MLKKWGFILLLLLLVVVGCTTETKEKVAIIDSTETTQVINEDEVNEIAVEDKEVEASTINSEESFQERLSTEFEVDMENFDAHLNKIQASLTPVVTAVSIGGKLSEEDFPLLLTNLEDTITFLENMQDYSELEKYENSYIYFKEGSQYLNKSYATFSSFFESQNQDASTFMEIFFKGFETYNQALAKFKEVGEVYVLEHQGNKINIPSSEEIKMTMSEKDGQHYWKGEKEIVNGSDWVSLDVTEKNQLIRLAIEQIESTGIVKTKKMQAEYVELLDGYFQEQTKEADIIKDVIIKVIGDEIFNKN